MALGGQVGRAAASARINGGSEFPTQGDDLFLGGFHRVGEGRDIHGAAVVADQAGPGRLEAARAGLVSNHGGTVDVAAFTDAVKAAEEQVIALGGKL